MANDRPILLVQSVVRDACRPICRKVAYCASDLPDTPEPPPPPPEGTERFFTTFAASTGVQTVDAVTFDTTTVLNTPQVSLRSAFRAAAPIEPPPPDTEAEVIFEASNVLAPAATVGLRMRAGRLSVYGDNVQPNEGITNVVDGALHFVEVAINLATGAIVVILDGVQELVTSVVSAALLLQTFTINITTPAVPTLALKAFRGIVADFGITVGQAVVFSLPLDQDISGVNITSVRYTRTAEGNWEDAQGNLIVVVY